jgi:hypothetical protein
MDACPSPKEDFLMKTRVRLFLLATAFTATALLSAAQPAASRCVPEMCFEVDLYTVCCYEMNCSLTCWSW